MNHIEKYYERFAFKDIFNTSKPDYRKMITDALFNFSKEVLKNTLMNVSIVEGIILFSMRGKHGEIRITKHKNSIEIIPILISYKNNTYLDKELIELIFYLQDLLTVHSFFIKYNDIPDFISKLTFDEFELQKSMRNYNL